MTQQWGQPGPYARQGQGGPNRPGQGQGGFGQGGFGQGGFGQGGQNPGWQQPGGWGQGYGPPGGQPARPGGQQPPMPGPGRPSSVPPQRPNPLRKVLIGVIALATIALAGLVVVNFTVGGADSAYQNEDYQPPPPDENPPELPVPETEEEARQLIEENALYQQSVPSPVRCEMEPIPEDASDEQLDEHLNELMACLMRVWEGPVTDAEWEIVRPSVTVYGDEIETKCGTAPGGNAFYCAADQQVYYSRTLPDTIPDLQGSRWGPDLVLAHEFGHAMQARTGILISTVALEQELGEDNPEALELSRRLELQADCFSGQFMASTSQSLGISQDEVPAMEKVFVAIGDDTLTGDAGVVGNHGRAESRLYWARQGISNSEVSACNSYTADSEQVR